MNIFVTGGTGFVGSAVVRELIDAGHQVVGLARSQAGASALTAAGARVHRGDITDLESLRSGAVASDAVIHAAFIHDFSKYKENCEIDRRAIEALGAALAGSSRTLIVTAGLPLPSAGRTPGEQDPPTPVSDFYPRASEPAAVALAQRGVRTSVIRLPQVHNTVKQGLISYEIAAAREKGAAAYIGDGLNRWAAAHLQDAARLYRLVLEKGEPGASYHAVAEEGVSAREIAEAIGRGLKVPVVSLSQEQAPAHFGWLAAFAGLNLTGSSELTRKRLGWRPTGPGLLADLEKMSYPQAA